MVIIAAIFLNPLIIADPGKIVALGRAVVRCQGVKPIGRICRQRVRGVALQIRYFAGLKLYPPMPAMARPSLIAPKGPGFPARNFRLMAAWTRWVR